MQLSVLFSQEVLIYERTNETPARYSWTALGDGFSVSGGMINITPSVDLPAGNDVIFMRNQTGNLTPVKLGLNVVVIERDENGIAIPPTITTVGTPFKVDKVNIWVPTTVEPYKVDLPTLKAETKDSVQVFKNGLKLMEQVDYKVEDKSLELFKAQQADLLQVEWHRVYTKAELEAAKEAYK